MNTLPTPEEVEQEARTIRRLGIGLTSEMLIQFAALLRNPTIQTLLKLQEGGDGTPMTDALAWNHPSTASLEDCEDQYDQMFDHSRNLELCARAIERETIERCAKIGDDLGIELRSGFEFAERVRARSNAN